MKLSNSCAKAGPMSEASALGLTCVPRLEPGHFESQPDSPRINQRLPSKLDTQTPGILIEFTGIPDFNKLFDIWLAFEPVVDFEITLVTQWVSDSHKGPVIDDKPVLTEFSI